MKLIRVPGVTGTAVYLNPDHVRYVVPYQMNGQPPDLTKCVVQFDGTMVFIQATVDRLGEALRLEEDIPVPTPHPVLTLKPDVMVRE